MLQKYFVYGNLLKSKTENVPDKKNLSTRE